MLTLHTAPGSCSRASHIALEEAGLDYQARYVDFARGDQRQPGFLAINPKGRVPALVTDRGVLTEGPAILAYRFWGLGVQRSSPAVAGFFGNLMPLFTALLSIPLLGQTPQLYHGLAFALIVGGIMVSSRRA